MHDADDSRDRRLPCHDRRELRGRVKPKRLEQREIAPAAADRRLQRETERDDRAGGQAGGEDTGSRRSTR